MEEATRGVDFLRVPIQYGLVFRMDWMCFKICLSRSGKNKKNNIIDGEFYNKNERNWGLAMRFHG